MNRYQHNLTIIPIASEAKQSSMPLASSTMRDENLSFVILAKARIQTCLHPHPLDSPPQADWNDSFTFELYFRSNDHLAGFNNLRKMEYRPQPVV